MVTAERMKLAPAVVPTYALITLQSSLSYPYLHVTVCIANCLCRTLTLSHDEHLKLYVVRQQRRAHNSSYASYCQ